MRIKLQPKVRSQLIKNAAWDLACSDGHIGGLTRQRVAQVANVATGTVSLYFAGKELTKIMALRAKRERRWSMLREVLPGGRYEGLVPLTRGEIRQIVDATIIPLHGKK